MSDSDSQTDLAGSVSVEIQTPDPGAEVFLLDGRLQVVARGVGGLQAMRPPGVYKLKVQTGQTIDEDLITLVKDKPFYRRLSPLPFATPVPLANTPGTDEALMAAAEKASSETQVTVGEGSGLFVFARDRMPDGQPAEAGHNPAAGLALYNAGGEKLVDLESQSAQSAEGEPYAACGVALSPGCYRLAVTVPGGYNYEQTVVTAAGWRTNIFLRQRPTRQVPGERRPDLADASISMCKSELPFSRYSEPTRMTETARLALVNRRAVVEGELLPYLKNKFEDPILGIFGGHLTLGHRPVDTGLMQEVVGNLRTLLGDQRHPDVEALALAADMPTDYEFAMPPMLRRSWAVVVQASATRPQLTPPGSVANAIAMLITNQDPWLIWERPWAGSPRKLDFAEAATRLVWPQTTRCGTPGFKEQAFRWYAKTIEMAIQHFPIFRFVSGGRIQDTIRLLKTDESMEGLVTKLGLPRGAIEEMLDTFYKGLS